MVHGDDTAGIIWHGFPVLMFGTSDTARQFHPIALCLCGRKKREDYDFCYKTLKTMRPDLPFKYSMSDAAGGHL